MIEQLAEFMAKMRYYGDAIAVLLGLAAIIAAAGTAIYKRLKRSNQ